MKFKHHDPDYMPKGGVKELLKSSDGRRYLQTLQKKYEIELLQPNNPKFYQVYGQEIKRNQSIKERQESASRQMWEENKERKQFERQKKQNPTSRRFF